MYGIHLAYNLIKPDDKVLDVGGWAQPFRRANAVIDFMPYEKRQTSNTFLLDIPERFSQDTWIQQDICDHRIAFPFQDKEFDFVVCGHVLEDIRDPFYVIEEMQRVGKRGYIEVPSRFYEQLLGLEYEGMCGAAHHRWFIDLRTDTQSNRRELVFLHKNHAVHFVDKYRLRKPKARSRYPYMNINFAVLGLLWEDEFIAREDVSAAIEGCTDFMKESLHLANGFGDKLWDQTAGFPCELVKWPFSKGIKTLWELENSIKRRVLPYDLSGSRTKEIIDYENKILLRQADTLTALMNEKIIANSNSPIRRFIRRFRSLYHPIRVLLNSINKK